MNLEDGLGIAFFVAMTVIAAALVINSRRSRRELVTRLLRAAAVIPIVVLLEGIVGFAIGGMVGLVGNSMKAFIMASWIGVVWAASGSRDHHANSSQSAAPAQGTARPERSA